MKKSSMINLGAVLLMAASGTAWASAISIPGGEIRFTAAIAFDDATTGYYNSPGNSPTNPGPAGVVCNTTATCDTVPPLVLTQQPRNTGLPGNPSEDTWGIGQLGALTQSGAGAPFWVSGQNGVYLTLMFYGLADQWVANADTDFDGSADLTRTNSIGGFVDIWETSTAPTNLGPVARSTGSTCVGGYNDNNCYPGYTNNGELVLHMRFVPGTTANARPNTTLAGSFDIGGISGSSASLLNVVGGTWAPRFILGSIPSQVTNPSYPLFDRAPKDASLSITYQCPGGSPSCDPTNSTPTLFSVIIEGNILAYTVPEPATLGLLSLGLLGVGGAIKRRRA